MMLGGANKKNITINHKGGGGVGTRDTEAANMRGQGPLGRGGGGNRHRVVGGRAAE